jgi:hypothetical protein
VCCLPRHVLYTSLDQLQRTYNKGYNFKHRNDTTKVNSSKRKSLRCNPCPLERCCEINFVKVWRGRAAWKESFEHAPPLSFGTAATEHERGRRPAAIIRTLRESSAYVREPAKTIFCNLCRRPHSLLCTCPGERQVLAPS